MMRERSRSRDRYDDRSYYSSSSSSSRHHRDYYYHDEDRHRHNKNNNDRYHCNDYNRNNNHHRDDGRRDHHDDRHRQSTTTSSSCFPYYKVVKTPMDEKIGGIQDDPRGEDPTKRITKKASSRGAGRNTESFDPASTLVRPDLRVQIGSPHMEEYNKPLKHDDVVIVPELFGKEDDWSTYYKLVEEMRELQAAEEEEEEQEKEQPNEKEDTTTNNNNKKKKKKKGASSSNSSSSSSKWISWHEGAHLISKNPKGAPTYEAIVARLCQYFNIDNTNKNNVGTRFNWYRDSSDWKPFHHDSAAFNPQRAKTQNITVGASFGAMRELAFIRASTTEKEEEETNTKKCKIYFPQSNNGVFSFGRDANIHWKHGINALHPKEQDGKGRISIILWGLAKNAIEEKEGSPPLLGANGRGPHAGGGRGRGGIMNHRHKDDHHNHRRRNNNNNDDRRRCDDDYDNREERDYYYYYRSSRDDDDRSRDNHRRR